MCTHSRVEQHFDFIPTTNTTTSLLAQSYFLFKEAVICKEYMVRKIVPNSKSHYILTLLYYYGVNRNLRKYNICMSKKLLPLFSCTRISITLYSPSEVTITKTRLGTWCIFRIIKTLSFLGLNKEHTYLMYIVHKVVIQ